MLLSQTVLHWSVSLLLGVLVLGVLARGELLLAAGVLATLVLAVGNLLLLAEGDQLLLAADVLAEGVGSGSAHINQLHNNSDQFSRLFRQILFA